MAFYAPWEDHQMSDIDQAIAALDVQIEKLQQKRRTLLDAKELVVQLAGTSIMTPAIGTGRLTIKERGHISDSVSVTITKQSLPEAISDVVRRFPGITTSEIADKVVDEGKVKIDSENPRRVILTRVGQLVEAERLVKDEETKRVTLPASDQLAITRNGSGHR
jgi:hypothetical protein